MTIRSDRTQNTLDEYLNSLRQRVQSGNNPPSGVFLELCHFAELYRRDIVKPAEPGAQGRYFSQTNQTITLQDIDELRELFAIERQTGKVSAMLKLEQLATKLK